MTHDGVKSFESNGGASDLRSPATSAKRRWIAIWISTVGLTGLQVAYGESIALKQERGTLVVPVLINDRITLNFTIDSGATDVSIPADVLSTLARAGTISTTDILDKQVYEQADGSKKQAQRFRIRSLRVGSVEIRDVTAVVAPEAASLLLGQSFLEQLQSWSIDNQRQVMLINESPTTGNGIATSQPDEVVTGSKWVLLGRSYLAGAAGPYEYVDVSSIQVSGNVRRAWFKSVPPRQPIKRSSMDQSRTLSRMAFNCDDETYRHEALNWVNANGSRDKVPAESYPGPWQSAIPDSEATFKLRWVCAWKPK